MRFSDIPGLSSIKKQLLTGVHRNKIAHAQLFCGIEGSATLPMALAYSSYLMCENRQKEDACGTCPSCQKASKAIHPDIHYFLPQPSLKSDPQKQTSLLKSWREFLREEPYGNLDRWQNFAGITDKAAQISKEEAKRIVKTVSLKAFEGHQKILLIWYPELMNISAANAILKTLEEPPPHTVYLLVSYAYEDIIGTITSRSQLVKIPPFGDEEIAEHLTQSGLEREEALRLARISEGSVLKANGLRSEDHLAYQDFQHWMRSCLKADFESLLKESEGFSQRPKSDQFRQWKFSINLFREAIIGYSENESLQHTQGEELAFIKKFGSAVSMDALEKMYVILNDAVYHLERNANPRITHMNVSIEFSKILTERVAH